MSLLVASGKTAFVPPSNQHALFTIYSTLDLVACVGMLILLVVGVRTKRLRSNLVLLNFELVIFFTALGQTLMTWTGYSYDLSPPFGLCLTSSAWIAGVATMKAGAAFSLTCKVWAHVLSVPYPNSRLLRVFSSTFILLAMPWLFGLPLFIAAFVMGALDHSIIRRSSVYYCLVDSHILSVVNMLLAAMLEVCSITFAIWTGVLVFKHRRRLRTLVVTQRSPIHYSLIIRTLVFGVALAAAMSIELIVALTDVTAPVPGMVIACIDFTAFVIFATDHILVRSMVRYVRGQEDSSLATGRTSQGVHTSVSVHISTSGPTHDEQRGKDGLNTHSVGSHHPKFVLAQADDADAYSLDDLQSFKKSGQ